MESTLTEPAEVYAALCVGLRDYVAKNGFRGALVALSGGIDSALVAAIAADALGPDRVTGITLPSPYSSQATHSDALDLAKRLGIPCLDIPIGRVMEGFIEELEPVWTPHAGTPSGEKSAGEARSVTWSRPTAGTLTEENLQARIRGVMTMALSNKFGWLVISTGNKSEVATGYCTLYGDMCGGFSILKDVPKTMVFELSRWRNQQGREPVIPPSTLERPPSAELRPGQKDTDSLPPYEILDPILERYIEQDHGYDEIVADGFDPETVRRVIRLVDTSEYKRRQGAPGIKITPRAFGRDRRMPITNHYQEPT
jgi:NAD+ synthase (glutamine-hydrolysing)